jgi:eukaryotic-like serine/threonine-protein kinase
MSDEIEGLKADWPALASLLDEVLELPVDQRAAWLDSLTGERAQYQVQLRWVLARSIAIEKGAFLETLPQLSAERALFDASLTTPSAGDLVGHYQLVELVGTGGMGSVWLAGQVGGELRRRVALKLPHLNWDSGLNERLTRERDILASLEHPNIARLYEAGVDQHGRPYLVLEYVEGQPIDVYCASRSLSIDDLLALILQIANAVAHAHTRLIIHRDLKPSNVLVTAEGQVRLLDFGIAKLMDGDRTRDSELTVFAGRALTVNYASPEQIRGEPIGTASDVYSLGVIAYQLLAGTPPYRFAQTGTAALATELESLEIPPASRVANEPAVRARLRGDLDAILNTALKKNAAERYPTVDAFAADIRRELANEPVLARPDSRGYRIRKFVARHRVEVGAVTLILAAVLAGAGVALWQAQTARIEAKRADEIKTFVLSVLADADVDSGASATTTAVDLLHAARARVDTELAAQPAVHTELLNTIAYGLVGYGDTAAGAEAAHEAIALGTRTLGPKDPRTLAAQVTYGEALADLGRSADAITLLRNTTEDAAQAGQLETQVNALRWLSSALIDEGDLTASESAARDAISIVSTPGAKVSARSAMDTYTAYANMLIFTQRPGVVAAMTEAQKWSHQIYGNRVTADTLEAQMMMGRGLVHEGHPVEGIRVLEQAGPAAAKFLGAQHPLLGTYGSWLGAMRLATGDVDGAILAYAQGAAVDDALPDATSVFNRGIDRLGLGTSYLAARRPVDAIAILDDSIQLLTAGSEATNPNVLRARSLHALALAQLGRLDIADREFAALDDTHWQSDDRAAHRGRLAVLRTLQGRHDEAVALARDYANGFTHHLFAWLRADAHRELGIALDAAGHPAEALPELSAALEDYRTAYLHMTPDQADTLLALGRAQNTSGDRAAAAKSLAASEAFWREFSARTPVMIPALHAVERHPST